jgi:hypothetical protein
MGIENINFRNLTREEAISKIVETEDIKLLPLAVWLTDSIACQRAYEEIRIGIANAERESEKAQDMIRAICDRVINAKK